MAPEQWTGAHAAGPPADVYAFGCMLYELFCGRRPFALSPSMTQAAPAAQRLLWERLHRDQPAPHPRDLDPELDLALAELLHACLRKSPSERPPSFSQLAGRLRHLHRRLLGRPSPRPEPTTGELLADSLTNRGVSFMSLGRPWQAERAWRAAVAADPGHPRARFNLALFAWQHAGATDDDLALALEELRVDESAQWREHLLAGRALLKLGRLHEALARLRLAVDHPGHAPEVARDYAAALVSLAAETGDLEPARRATELLRQEGGALRADPRMLACYALASRRLGNTAAAERLWRELRRIAPDLPEDEEAAAERLLPAVLADRRLTPECARIGFVAVTPNGRVGLAGGDSGAVAVWDLLRGQRVSVLHHEGATRVRCAAVTPDGQRCLTSVEGGAVTVWDLGGGGAPVRLQPHTGVLSALAVSRDGRLAAGVGSAGTLFTWDITTGRRSLALKTHPGNATCVTLWYEGRRAAVGGGDGQVVVVDLEQGSELAGFAAHQGGVLALAAHPASGRLVSGGEDGVVRRWLPEGGEPLAVLSGHRAAVRGLALHADGVRCLSASDDGTLRVWDLDAGGPVLALDRGEPVPAAAASADWNQVLLAVAGEVHRPRLGGARGLPSTWALAVPVTSSEAEERSRRFRNRIDTVHGLIASERYEQALEAIESARSVAGYAREREVVGLAAQIAFLFPHEALRDGWQERTLDAHDGEVVSAAIASGERRAVTGGRDRRLVVWTWPEGECETVLEHPSVPLALRVLAGDRQLASADLDGAVRLWDLDGAGLLQQLGGHEARVNSLALDLLGRVALSASEDGTARVWDPSTGGCRQVLRGHLGRVLAAAVSPDGRFGLTGGDDGSLLLWELASGRGIGELEGHTGPVHDLVWSTDGRFVLSAGGDGCARLWEIARGKALRVLDEGIGEPRRAALTPDGRFAVIGEKRGRLSVWALRSRTRERVFEGHTDAVTAVEVAPDGRRVLSTSADGSARVWYLDWRPQVRPFAEWDEAARPHLEVFLQQQVPGAGGGRLRPEWSERDVEGLLRDLGRRGFGWLRPDGVRRRLGELAASWNAERPDRPAPTSRSQPTRRVAATPHARLRWRLAARRIAIALVITIPLLIGAAHLTSRHALRLDSARANVLRARNMAVLLVPLQMARAGPCDPTQLDSYLRDFTGSIDSPGDVGRAIHCLQELRDPLAVPPILDMVRPLPSSDQPDLGIGSDSRRIRQAVTRSMSGGLTIAELVASTLARFGEPAVPGLRRALADPEPAVRSAAASALALSGSQASVDALRFAAEDPDDGTREAAAQALATLVVGGGLELAEGFELAERLAADPDPRVRAAAAASLAVFAGTRARRLLDRLAHDEDPEVRRAAGAR